MNTSFFKSKLKKPSNAVQAMIDGLWAMNKEPDIKINMSYFYNKRGDGPCMVCAATATAMQVTQTPVGNLLACVAEHEDMPEVCPPWDTMAEAMRISGDELAEFELMVNSLRLGYTCDLLEYFDVPKEHAAYAVEYGFMLDTRNWFAQMPRVESYRDTLIELGL